ncbi:MAG: histidine phosphatase family protein [Clostridia bacterium]|nr:histidine phosphatase family protein [Clostridia bacterium]
MKLYVVRHGQTDWNVEKRFQGRTDTLLTHAGRQQAKNLSETFKNIDVDFILSSPLQRAIDTANIINESKNLNIIIEPKLIERNFGDFEGLNDISSFNCSINKLLDYNLNYNLHHVEPIQDLFKRISSLLFELKTNFPNKKIILSTHGGIVQILELILKNLPKETNLQSLSLNNCEFRTYDINV